jgi:glycosyltransferase involved in cell wall biosynthesis
MVDLLYVAHNRLAYSQATFSALIANTNWEHVKKLHVLDDASTDGTWDYISGIDGMIWDVPVSSEPYAMTHQFGGPVAAMNYALDHCETDVLVKTDSDLLLCPGWLDALLGVIDSAPQLDALGFEAGFGEGLAPAAAPRSFLDARYIGGIGAFRTRIFSRHRPRPHERFFGLTEFWRRHARCGWLTPDLPCVLLDHLPFEPWRSLAAEYVGRGWSRGWPAYPESMRDYWAWAFDAEAVA